MLDGLKLFAVLVTLIALLFKRVNLSLTMLIGFLLLGLLFNVGVSGFWKALFMTVTDYNVWEVLAVIILVLFLNGLLKDTGTLQRMSNKLSDILGDMRMVIFFPPMIVGFLPMPAGALFTASLTDEIGNKLKAKPSLKHFINYWFRHIWEYSLPLYPSVIFEAAALGVSLAAVISYQWYIVFIAMALGAISSWFRFRRPEDLNGFSFNFKKLLDLLFTTWTVLFVLIGFLAFKINLVLLLLVAVLGEVLSKHLHLKQAIGIFKSSVDFNLIAMVFTIFCFQSMLKVSNAVYVVPNLLKAANVPILFSLFFFPFLISFMTGISTAAVALTFPLLVPLMGDPVNLKLAAWSFVSGYSGHLVSPFHLCLITTKEYYKVRWSEVYLELIPVVFAVLLITLVITII
ncbi:MAG: DUF401 family protein [Synergistetes bacterium]|nr:DUF401 family protein [Synergistota bacterium]MCX8127612.1 DUF401 family protein [Synergistota bacterium]MDW8191471.1 DUF401 family protein [Synergistota bacterium]